MLPVSEEMREWSSAMIEEVSAWPKVTSRPVFGFRVFYRGKSVFAGLPVSRALGSSSSLIFKFQRTPEKLLKKAQEDPRLRLNANAPGPGWHSFELSSSKEIRDALWWLNQAYEAAKP